MLLCDLKGCSLFFAVIPMTDGNCEWNTPHYFKSTTSWDWSESAEDGEDGGVADNENGCTTGTSSCVGEWSWNGNHCNKRNTAAKHLYCNREVLVVGFLHDGKVYDDDFQQVPAETQLVFAGKGTVQNFNVGMSEVNSKLTAASTIRFESSDYNSGMFHDEDTVLTFDSVCEAFA